MSWASLEDMMMRKEGKLCPFLESQRRASPKMRQSNSEFQSEMYGGSRCIGFNCDKKR